MQSKLPIVFLFGPTATGKTRTALHLAQHLPCDIISVDAIQVYKGLDIGSAKPDKTVLAEYPHHLVDIREPDNVYSVADFYTDAVVLIRKSLRNRRIPLLVGGSMMYFAVLERGLADLPHPDIHLRSYIQAVAHYHGWSYWHRYLSHKDPETAMSLSVNDRQRLQRAVEVWLQTGRSLRWLQRETSQPGIKAIIEQQMPDTRLIKVGLAVRDKVAHKIKLKQRFLQMLNDGLLVETEHLYHRKGIDLSLSAINSVGYRQIWQYIEGRLSYKQMLSEAITATRRLAKHQMTWLKSWQEVQLFYCEENNMAAIQRLCAVRV